MVGPVVFSASSVNAYLDCRLRWYFTYILNEPGEQSEAQQVGITVHNEAENILRSVGPRNATWSEYGIKAIDSLVAVFVNDILPTYRDPVLIEAPFQIEVNGIPFSGIIDSVDRQDVPWGFANVLRDLKTTGKRPPAGRYHFNMTGYWLGARELGYTPDIMQLDYIVRTAKPYYWPEVVQAPNENELESWAAILSAVARGVESGDYNPTGLGTRACLSCPHRAICGPYTRYQEVTDEARQHHPAALFSPGG